MTHKTTLERGAALLMRASKRTVAVAKTTADGPVGTAAKVFAAGAGVLTGVVVNAATSVQDEEEVHKLMPSANDVGHPSYDQWWGDDEEG